MHIWPIFCVRDIIYLAFSGRFKPLKMQQIVVIFESHYMFKL